MYAAEDQDEDEGPTGSCGGCAVVVDTASDVAIADCAGEDTAMSGDPHAVSLHGWQACLAIAQQRLANPDFRLDVRESCESIFGPASFEGTASGLGVSLLETGMDLLSLVFRLGGVLRTETQSFRVGEGSLEITTSLQTVDRGDHYAVVPRLDDPDLAVGFTCTELGSLEKALIQTCLRNWIRRHVASNPFALFSFASDLGHGAAPALPVFAVSSAYAKYSPEYSSLLVLFGDSRPPGQFDDLTIDPHVLPNGQTAVLWISPELLHRSGGQALVDAAESELALRPRGMNVDVPRVSEAVRRWSASIIGKLTIPGGLELTSMQMLPPGLMLSATPLSIGELDALRACDPTLDPPDRVQVQAESLFRDCLLHYMNPQYRKNLLDKDLPALPREVRQITAAQGAWYAKYARLELARAIAGSVPRPRAPFDRLEAGRIDRKLREMRLSETFEDQSAKLYALAFCLVHPRISLYMDDAANWLGPYREHLTSDAYADRLADEIRGLGGALDEAPRARLLGRIHEDIAKLTVLDLSRKTARETLPATVASLLQRLAQREWKSFLAERRDRFADALARVLGVVDSEAGADELRRALAAAGGRPAVASALTAQLAHSAACGSKSLEAAIDEFCRAWPAHSATLRSGLSFATSRALAGVLLEEIEGDLADEDRDAPPTDHLEQLASGFSSALRAGLDLARLLKEKLTSVLITSAKTIRWAGQKLLEKLLEGATRLLRGVRLFAGILAGALALLSAALSINDAVADFRNHRYGAAVTEVLAAGVSLFSVLAISMSWSGPVSWTLIAVGLILVAIRFIFFGGEGSPSELARTLLQELATDGATA